MPMRKAGFICVGVYHIRNAVAAGGLRFFSDALRAYIFPLWIRFAMSGEKMFAF